jgi:L-iditol 2-dehydrogenase
MSDREANQMNHVPKRMRAVVYRGPNDLRLETLDVPRIRPEELLVRVAACGVCPTDIKKIQGGTVTPPRIFGHETAGVIVRVGSRVRGFRAGDRVALHHHVPCLKCHHCRHRAFAQCAVYRRTGITAGYEAAGGGYAEYVRVMSFVLPGVVRIPAGNDFVEGAMLEPVNTVLKAVERLSVMPGDTVLVMGQGPIGLMFTRLLRLRGVAVVATDLMEERLRWARRYGAGRVWRGDDTSWRETVMRLTRGRGLDAVVVAVPLGPAVQQALELVRGGGRVLLFAHTKRDDPLAIDLATVCVDEKDLVGSYSSDVTLQRSVARLVFGRQLDVRPLITHAFPLERTAEAVALASRPTPASLKVVVVPAGGLTGATPLLGRAKNPALGFTGRPSGVCSARAKLGGPA